MGFSEVGLSSGRGLATGRKNSSAHVQSTVGGPLIRGSGGKPLGGSFQYEAACLEVPVAEEHLAAYIRRSRPCHLVLGLLGGPQHHLDGTC